MNRGRFITLEGGEGTGKSTLLNALREKLEAIGLSVVVTREPGGTELAETIRNLVLHPPNGQVWSSMAEALLMNAARTRRLVEVHGDLPVARMLHCKLRGLLCEIH